MPRSRDEPKTFENTYPKHAFSELVRLALRLASWICARRGSARARPKPNQPHMPQGKRLTGILD